MNKLFTFMISLMFGAFIASCGSSGGGNNNNNSACTDPTGTVSTALGVAPPDSHGAALSQAFSFHTGSIQHTTNCTGNYDECEIWFIYNFTSGAAWNNNGTTNAWIADAGAVNCLGDVTTIPTSGFTTTAESTVGHGYVMKLFDGSYARFYLDSYVDNTSGGIIGANIKWQYPFEPSTLYSLTVTPTNGAVANTVASDLTTDIWGIVGCTNTNTERCTYYYAPSTTVILKGTGGATHTWGGDCSSTASTCSLTMDADKAVTITTP